MRAPTSGPLRGVGFRRHETGEEPVGLPNNRTSWGIRHGRARGVWQNRFMNRRRESIVTFVRIGSRILKVIMPERGEERGSSTEYVSALRVRPAGGGGNHHNEMGSGNNARILLGSANFHNFRSELPFMWVSTKYQSSQFRCTNRRALLTYTPRYPHP